MKKIIIYFILMVLISPWLITISRNFSKINIQDEKRISFNKPFYIEQINTLRGEVVNKGFPVIGKLFYNKPAYFLREIYVRFLESYNPHYLFFEGDPDLRRGTKASGVLYLGYLPLILAGINYFLLKGSRRVKRILITAGLAVSLIPSLFENHNDTLVRIPFLIFLTLLGAFGLDKLILQRRKTAIFIAILIIYEFLRFYHDFLVHYPSRAGLL